jgi:hypothetical protein
VGAGAGWPAFGISWACVCWVRLKLLRYAPFVCRMEGGGKSLWWSDVVGVLARLVIFSLQYGKY